MNTLRSHEHFFHDFSSTQHAALSNIFIYIFLTHNSKDQNELDVRQCSYIEQVLILQREEVSGSIFNYMTSGQAGCENRTILLEEKSINYQAG